MGIIELLTPLLALGVFIISLRLLHNVLDRSATTRIRGILSRFVATQRQCLVGGFFLTLLLHSSNITIVTAMGLVSASLITLEQGFLMMLGATLGTTVKVWIFTQSPHWYGGFIFLIFCLILFMSYRASMKDMRELILAIGLAYCGFNILMAELLPLAGNHSFTQFLLAYQADPFSRQALAMLVACLLTASMQSSTGMIFLTIGLATQGLISLNTGAAFILGANLGATSTGFLLSLSKGPSAKRLAIGHLEVKLVGVGAALLLFPSLLSLTAMLFHTAPTPGNLQYHLAGLHTLFNLLNVACWISFSTFMARLLRWLVPHDNDKNGMLPPVVRRMLVSNPDLTLQEVELQMKKAELATKKLVDYCFEILLSGVTAKTQFSIGLARDFDNARECIAELLLKISRYPLPDSKISYINRKFKLISEYADFNIHTVGVCTHIEKGMLLDAYSYPPSLHQHFEALQQAFNQIWVAIFLKQNHIDNADVIAASIVAMQTLYFSSFSKDAQRPYEYLVWLYETFGDLEQMAGKLRHLGVAVATLTNQP